MAQITDLIFLSLEGETPPALGLPPLRTARSTFDTVRKVLSRFAESPDFALFCSDAAVLPSAQHVPSASTVRVFYLMGHAWKADSEYQVALVDHGRSTILSGSELLERISEYFVGPAILIIDTCSAGTLLGLVESRAMPNLTCIAASEDDETAREFGLDRSTRFAATLAETLGRHSSQTEIEVIEVALGLRSKLARPSLVAAQNVEIWSSGRPITLSAKESGNSAHRPTRTYLFLRALFTVIGIAVAAIAVSLTLYYRDHIQVEWIAGPLENMRGPVILAIDEEQPDANQDTLLETHELYRNGATRLRLPATDLVFVIEGSFDDGRPREIRFPLLTKSSFSAKDKFYQFTLPSDAEIREHPDMAYVMKTRWLEGSERVSATNSEDFWIDLAPVTVETYLPIAEQFVREGKIESFESVLLTERAQARAVQATNLKQVPKLLGQLQDIFDVVNAEQRATRQPDPSNKTPLPEVFASCPRCPAKVTMEEAKLYCASQQKRLPTDVEWELAARGVDGRLYPWGNEFDSSRANVPGLPEKGQTTGLVSVDFYPNAKSPFGLIDTIGNAGDWIDSRGRYERTFIGGTYRFNKEDALTYSTLPDTGDPLPNMPVTVRCVSPVTQEDSSHQ